ncbi:hypothetical protein NKH36_34095 [Mesorhizobium sp. M1312]|uniref:hypothetical protein n=1 Tax=unclassified Mesorhizobium TaxID=325217 RepID=UPI003336C7C4
MMTSALPMVAFGGLVANQMEGRNGRYVVEVGKIEVNAATVYPVRTITKGKVDHIKHDKTR